MEDVWYTTEAVVKVKSRALWCISSVLQLLTAGVVLVYLPWQCASLQWSQEGATVAWLYSSGSLWLNSSQASPWDLHFFSPHSEATALLFLPTNLSQHFSQQRSVCADYTRSCTSSKQCLGTCVQGLCEEPAWCSSSSPNAVPVRGIEEVKVVLSGLVQFLWWDESIHDYRSKAWTIEELIGDKGRKELPKRVRLELFWDCRYEAKDCRPSLLRRIHRTAVRPYREKAEYRQEKDGLYRDVYSAEGVEIEVTSKGRIGGFSVYLLVLYLSLLCILLQATDSIVDFYASTCFARISHSDRFEFDKAKYSLTTIPLESWAVLSSPSSETSFSS